MNESEFAYLLKKPDIIEKNQTDALDIILKEFPYFQSARAIHLKGLQKQESYRFNNCLKITAAYTQNRTVLFDFITQKHFEQHTIAKAINQQKNLSESPHRIAEKTSPTQQETNKQPENQFTETRLAVGKPFSFDEKEQHSFNQWLQLTQAKPIIREGETNSSGSKTLLVKEKVNRTNLINRFITSNPKIIPSQKSLPTKDIAKETFYNKSVLMTETLAKVYLEQKKYKKAIKAYKILSLKYPEKSSLFAGCISEIKKLKEYKKTR